MGQLLTPQTNYPPGAGITPVAAQTTTQQTTTVVTPTVVSGKKWYLSTTVWINAATLALYGLQYVVDQKVITDPNALAIALAVINVLLRLKTTTPLSR